MLIHIREDNTLGLKYYTDLNDAPVTDILSQYNIKTKNHLVAGKINIESTSENIKCDNLKENQIIYYNEEKRVTI